MVTKARLSDLSNIMANTSVTAVVFGRGGNQIRTVINGGRRHATFMYPSKRYRRGQCGDGHTELRIHMISEALPERLDFLPQPCRIEAEVCGKPTCAFPDYAHVDLGRRPVLGEAKRHWEDFERPSALVQQAVTRKGAEALGWDYEQVTSTSLGDEGFLSAVEEVQTHRFVHVPTGMRDAALAAIGRHGEMPLSDLASEMHEKLGRATAFACALVVQRAISIDLTRPISGSSVVRPAPDLPFAHPRIRL